MSNPQSFQDLPAREVVPGFTGRFLHGEKHTLGYWEAKAGSTVPVHQHPHEQMSYVLSGTLEMELDGVKHTLHAHDVLQIPSNAPHGAYAVTDCRLIDSFSPVREDYK
ncbi:cupin domain-containing protein [Chitinophaga barathri]|uniref:Cupin domain-containing protein n=1 Tax=Chitinophaga barathri TaxID=1647451 RepID=A0A3N4ME09_9BACT|nr:cupin domain-containing protein [Chitinophaga barathri]RPD41818.1 cupin domain-containing protein [Chitinophaga barathri]